MHFGLFEPVAGFEPTKCIFCDRFPIEPKKPSRSKIIYKSIDATVFWTDLNHHTPSHTENKDKPKKMLFRLDRFELPHQVETTTNVNTKKLYSFHGQIQTIENQILPCRSQRKSHGNKTVTISIQFQLPNKLEFA